MTPVIGSGLGIAIAFPISFMLPGEGKPPKMKKKAESKANANANTWNYRINRIDRINRTENKRRPQKSFQLLILFGASQM